MRTVQSIIARIEGLCVAYWDRTTRIRGAIRASLRRILRQSACPMEALSVLRRYSVWQPQHWINHRRASLRPNIQRQSSKTQDHAPAVETSLATFNYRVKRLIVLTIWNINCKNLLKDYFDQF